MTTELDILLYNKVELDDGTQGIVRYVGNIMGKKGTFCGIDVTKGDSKNDGTFKGIKYFDTKKGGRTGRFCKLSKIKKCKKTSFSKYEFKLNETVLCTKTKCKGSVKYIGCPSWVKGGKVYYGLELNKKKGTCNGTNNGVQYFETNMNFGIYVPAKYVQKIEAKKTKKKTEKKATNNKKTASSKKKSASKKKGKKSTKKKKKSSKKDKKNDAKIEENDVKSEENENEEKKENDSDKLDEEKKKKEIEMKEKIEREEKEERERIKKENELREEQRLKKEKEELEKQRLQKIEEEKAKQRKAEEEKQRLLKIEQEKEKKRQEEEEEEKKQMAKIEKEKEKKQKEEKISYENAGNIKDRMAMFQTKNDSKKAKPAIANAPKQEKKQQTVLPKANKEESKVNNDGVGAPVGSEQAINFEMEAAFGKPLKSIKMTKVNGYDGEIPLVLHLLGQKLTSLNAFGTFKIFHPEQMEKEKDKPAMAIANNIFVFFCSLPEPLLATVPQSVKDKAINKDVMKDVVKLIDEPYASTLIYLWDLLSYVAMNEKARMGQQSLGKVFGPLCTMVTQQDVKGNRVSMNALGASRMMAFFRRGIEYRMEINGYDFESSSDDSD